MGQGDRKIKNRLRKLYEALIEEAIAKAPDEFCLLQMYVIYGNFMSTRRLPQADIDILNEVAFQGKPMWWSEKEGFTLKERS